MTVTAQVENLTQRLEELKPLLPHHHKEIAIYQDRMPLDPDYGAYLAADARGELCFVTARKDGELVGYALFFVKPHLHYRRTLTATMDLIYLWPDHRLNGTGRLMGDVLMNELRRRGVGPVWGGSKYHCPIDGFWRAMGMERAETMFVTWLGDDDA